jgi:hypothetical protein
MTMASIWITPICLVRILLRNPAESIARVRKALPGHSEIGGRQGARSTLACPPEGPPEIPTGADSRRSGSASGEVSTTGQATMARPLSATIAKAHRAMGGSQASDRQLDPHDERSQRDHPALPQPRRDRETDHDE